MMKQYSWVVYTSELPGALTKALLGLLYSSASPSPDSVSSSFFPAILSPSKYLTHQTLSQHLSLENLACGI